MFKKHIHDLSCVSLANMKLMKVQKDLTCDLDVSLMELISLNVSMGFASE